MSFQRKKSRRVTEIKFSKSEIFDQQPSLSLTDRTISHNSTMSETITNQKFHRKHEKRTHPTSNFFKRMKTLPLNSSHDLEEELEKKILSSHLVVAKPEQKIEDVMMSHERYVKHKQDEKKLNKTLRDHRQDNRKLSSLFSDKFKFHQEINHRENQNTTPNKTENVTERDLKYLPMHDILNYQGQVTSNPKLIERRVLHKVKKAFMGR